MQRGSTRAPALSLPQSLELYEIYLTLIAASPPQILSANQNDLCCLTTFHFKRNSSDVPLVAVLVVVWGCLDFTI